jgi:porin
VPGVGFARTQVNPEVVRSERLSGPIIQHSEYGGAIHYSLHPFDWLEMRPDFQWICHPSGDGDAADIGVMGLDVDITL